ncbi:hypothetical protein FA13DRAFT_1732621 [Coprinellus micaceus]|uniref:Uncharacterized protein n=1 Tax=Coprinellus micaceus TaxID=71717 RepID=A0A4Y7TCQ0_COPMI|nr:hypothetical protein FA13DRAFT_1732621 [Coprinellus micaceus]
MFRCTPTALFLFKCTCIPVRLGEQRRVLEELRKTTIALGPACNKLYHPPQFRLPSQRPLPVPVSREFNGTRKRIRAT